MVKATNPQIIPDISSREVHSCPDRDASTLIISYCTMQSRPPGDANPTSHGKVDIRKR